MHQHINVALERAIVEWGRRSRCVNPGWLNTAPFETETEGIQAKTPATGKILGIASPEISRLSCRHDIPLSLRSSPVRLRLTRAIVPTFGLVSRSRDAPEETTHVDRTFTSRSLLAAIVIASASSSLTSSAPILS